MKSTTPKTGWIGTRVSEWEGPDPRTVIALADALALEHQRIVRASSPILYRFQEASREFWAALSADGTGESPVLSTHLDVMGEGK